MIVKNNYTRGCQRTIVFKHLLRNCLANQSQILCRASLGSGKESLYKLPRWQPCSFMVKPSKIFCYSTKSPMIMKLGMELYVFKLYKVYINDDPELTLTLKTMSNFAKLVFCTYSISRYQVSVYRTIGPLVL